MKSSSSINQHLGAILLGAIVCGSALAPSNLFASGGSSSPTTKTGEAGAPTSGQKGGRTTPAPTPTPAPAPAPLPIVTAPINFTAAASVGGVIPVCSGSYRIDPYYPTLSLMTITVQCSQMNEPDDTILYLNASVSSGAQYPTTVSYFPIVSQAGACTYSAYVVPGTTLTNVTITDSTGAVICAGN